MSHHRFRPLGIAVILAVAIGLAGAPPGAAQASRRGEPRLAFPQPGLLERAWEWLAGWSGGLPGVQGLSRIWAEDYAGLDPNGAKTTGTPPAPVQPTTDMGPGLDPDGHH